MNSRAALIAFRTFFGLLVWVAVVYQAGVLQGQGLLNAANYFSYFTIVSNIFAATVFLVSTWYLIAKRKPTRRDDLIRGASVLYMFVTGVVYVTLLRGYEVNTDLAWVNAVLHYIMPLAVVADWLYQPQYSKLRPAQAGVWLIFPSLFLAYTLLRGPIVHWYPYPFLNPDYIGGYANVALYCAAILIAFVVLGYVLLKAGNSLRRHVM